VNRQDNPNHPSPSHFRLRCHPSGFGVTTSKALKGGNDEVRLVQAGRRVRARNLLIVKIVAIQLVGNAWKNERTCRFEPGSVTAITGIKTFPAFLVDSEAKQKSLFLSGLGNGRFGGMPSTALCSYSLGNLLGQQGSRGSNHQLEDDGGECKRRSLVRPRVGCSLTMLKEETRIWII
jgi:hypothetical protein